MEDDGEKGKKKEKGKFREYSTTAESPKLREALTRVARVQETGDTK